MRNAYALLGISFAIVFGGAFVLLSGNVQAPSYKDLPLQDNELEIMSLTLTTSAFKHNESIPSKYTCDGENISPPLSISGIPDGAKSLVVLMDDSDIPNEVKERMNIEKFNHWSIYNIPIGTNEILEGVNIGVTGNNTRGETSYTGPCPPSEFQPTEHRYIFRLYALSGELDFENTPTLDEIEEATRNITIEKAELVGFYEKEIVGR